MRGYERRVPLLWAVLLAFESIGASPIERDKCPSCGHDAFEFVG